MGERFIELVALLLEVSWAKKCLLETSLSGAICSDDVHPQYTILLSLVEPLELKHNHKIYWLQKDVKLVVRLLRSGYSSHIYAVIEGIEG